MPQDLKDETLRQNILDYLLQNGAVSVGIATRESLQDSPPSAAITYLMENAFSAVSFALPINKEYIRTFLAKEDRTSRERDEGEANIRVRELSDGLAEMIKGGGNQAIGTSPNYNYRTDTDTVLMPQISHRYLAVASGVGCFGWSGNVGIEGYGTCFVLGTTITDAKLEPTAPIAQEDGFCSDCKACVRACPVDMFSLEDETSVTLGGVAYTYAARIDLRRCYICCGGASGLHKSKKWSSWSAGRFGIPEDDDGIQALLGRSMWLKETRWPEMDGEYLPVNGYLSTDSKIGLPDFISEKLHITCGNCQLVCTGDAKENLENLKVLRSSGCVIQYPDGSLKVLPGDEAEAEFNRFPPEHRALYC